MNSKLKSHQEKYWKNYEIQKPDGTWTTVANLLSEHDQLLIDLLEEEKDASLGECKTCGGFFPCVHQDLYFQGLSRAQELIRGGGE